LERDYLYLDDVVAGYLAVADHLPEVSGEAFNLGTERLVSVLDVVERIIGIVGDEQVRAEVLGVATNEIDRQSLAFDKASKRLGWRPEVDLEKGLMRTVGWYEGYLSRVAERAESGSRGKEEEDEAAGKESVHA
jgi:nucleoside-diphosphate-sugar epimerase